MPALGCGSDGLEGKTDKKSALMEDTENKREAIELESYGGALGGNACRVRNPSDTLSYI